MNASLSTKYLEIQGVEQTFKTAKGLFPALQGIDLQIAKGEFVSLIGHSGCGKSTLLNLIAGLTTPTAGALLCANKEIKGPGPERAVVFQNHSLLPWLTCWGNVHLAVERVFGAKESKAQLKARTDAALELVGLGHAAQKRPGEISGGMKQRVGIARALAINPKMLLMDEPFSALDALTRGALQDEVARLVAESEQTGFMITHDVDEAILLADRILLMSNGPEARIAEVVLNTLPKPRTRANLHHMPGYHALRDHILDFLIARSRAFKADAPPAGWSARAVPEVSPALSAPPLAAE
jgi:nitrate/nitrite transport system ATP-binding protein